MGRRRGQSGMQQQVKGFRPGKEPSSLRKRALKQQMGEMSATQERMVELFADRTPQEARAMIGRWHTGTLIAGIVLSILTVLAWSWSWIAGLVVGLIATAVLFSHLRLRAQRAQLEQMAEAVSKASGGG